MKYYDNLKFNEIAELLHVNENTLKTAYYKTIKLIEKDIQTLELYSETQV